MTSTAGAWVCVRASSRDAQWFSNAVRPAKNLRCSEASVHELLYTGQACSGRRGFWICRVYILPGCVCVCEHLLEMCVRPAKILWIQRRSCTNRMTDRPVPAGEGFVIRRGCRTDTRRYTIGCMRWLRRSLPEREPYMCRWSGLILERF